MNLQEVFDQLTCGELSMLKLGGAESGAIPEASFKNVVGSVNLGLTALFKRFNLKEGRLTLILVPGQTIYPLTTEFIEDTLQSPFQDDVLKVEKVKTASGFEMSVNEANDEYSIMTPSMTTIEVPKKVLDQGADLPSELRGDKLTVIYRANHPKIVVDDDFEPEEVNLLLPDSHLQALLYFVASRHYNPIGMVNEFNMGNNWFSKYEMECQRLTNEGLEVNQSNKEDNFRRNGWV